MPFEQEQHHGTGEANLGVYWPSLKILYKDLGVSSADDQILQ